MTEPEAVFYRSQLMERRGRLEAVRNQSPETAELGRLLGEVDAALGRIGAGTFGLCDECHDPIEADRLTADPLIRHCLDCLAPDERRAMEMDLDLAHSVQRALLPGRGLRTAGWEAHYQYEPAGSLSGDYCDLLAPGADGGGLLFVAGDVAGKGIASSLLMSHLHAIFRSLGRLQMPLTQIVEHANRVFCESTMPSLYATLACGLASESGEVELCNAGHCPPVLAGSGPARTIEATGLPLGLFCNSQYGSWKAVMDPGDTLLLYTDGLTETPDGLGNEYGIERLLRLAESEHGLPLDRLGERILEDAQAFRGGGRPSDDLTLLLIRRRRETIM